MRGNPHKALGATCCQGLRKQTQQKQSSRQLTKPNINKIRQFDFLAKTVPKKTDRKKEKKDYM